MNEQILYFVKVYYKGLLVTKVLAVYKNISDWNKENKINKELNDSKDLKNTDLNIHITLFLK